MVIVVTFSAKLQGNVRLVPEDEMRGNLFIESIFIVRV
jgi:hypothetical protein